MRQLAESMDPIPGRSRRERLPPQDRQADGAARGGFRWTLDGGAEVVAPDWDPTPVCGGGLHGLLNGAGSGGLIDWSTDAVWIVAEIPDGGPSSTSTAGEGSPLHRPPRRRQDLRFSPLTATEGVVGNYDGRGLRHCDGRGPALRRPGTAALRFAGTTALRRLAGDWPASTAGTRRGTAAPKPGTLALRQLGTTTLSRRPGTTALRRPGTTALRPGTPALRFAGDYGTATAGVSGFSATAGYDDDGRGVRRPGTTALRRPGTTALRRPGARTIIIASGTPARSPSLGSR